MALVGAVERLVGQLAREGRLGLERLVGLQRDPREAVRVHVDQVAAVAVLVDPVVGGLRGSGEDLVVEVVAVGAVGGAIPVFVDGGELLFVLLLGDVGAACPPQESGDEEGAATAHQNLRGRHPTSPERNRHIQRTR
jgi:hypothetical protein